LRMVDAALHLTRANPTPSWNPFDDLAMLFHYDFMIHAFQAGTMVAIVAGSIGYFVVLRGSAFAAHALSHIGFAGAAGAVVAGLSPVVGLLAFTLGSGAAIGALGNRLRGRDVTIGIVLAWTLGLGVLFISLYRGYATEAYALLFGEILGISERDVLVTLVAGVITIVALVTVYRPLLFSSVDEELASAKGVPVTGLSIVFMAILAVAVTEAVQVVGVLLIFALIVALAAFNYLRPIPAIAATPLLHATEVVPGNAPALPWPAKGSAAVAVSGLGFVGTSGNEQAIPAASVTKVMTALVVLEDSKLKKGDSGANITIGDADVRSYQADLADQQSVVKVELGEQLTLFQVLEGMLIPSANNLAETVARWDAGSIAAFVAKMNGRPGQLHLTHTKFADTSGASA